MKKIFLILVLCANIAKASCLLGDAQVRAGRLDRAIISYETCALQNNDAQGQYTLGVFYRDGKEPVKQNMKIALFYFRLASENGYAPAQRDLAELMDTLQGFGAAGQDALKDYDEQMQGMKLGQDLSAFAWALLAAEKTDNKWFYPSPAISDAKAEQLVKKWTSSKGTAAKQQATQEAMAWKKERLIKSAAQLLPLDKYGEFMQKMYPKENNRQTTAIKRQAMADLKQIWESKKNQ